MSFPKKSIFTLLLSLLILFTFRWLATEHFKPYPEASPPVVVDKTTSLYKAIDYQLVSDNAKDSLFMPLGNANLALISRIKLADAAEKSLDLQYYLFHDDNSGQALLAAVIEAADRGVKVRILMDDMDTAGREGTLMRLTTEHPNLSIRVFNPIYTRWFRPIDFIARFPRSSRRMHNKSFNADTVVSIIGGRNIGNEYFSINTNVGFLDYDALSAGPIATDIEEEFNTYWFSGIAFDIAKLGTPATDKKYKQWTEELSKSISTYRKGMEKLENLTIDKLLAKDLNAYLGDQKVIYDTPEKVLGGLFDRGDWLAPKIANLMSESNNELFIISPYFIPEKEGMELFKKLRDRGVSITILTNSFSANDVIAVHSGYIDYRKKLLEIGVKLFELKSDKPEGKKKNFQILGSKQSSLHAKTFLVDKKLTFIGSFNLDPRSAMHNTEMGIVFKNAKYGEKANKIARLILEKQAYEVFLSHDNHINWRESIIKNDQKTIVIHDIEPETTFFQRTLIQILSWLPIEWLL